MAEIRPMTSGEVQQLVQWADAEGWNPGRNDADCFWQLDPDGFLALVEDNELIGGGAIIRYSDTFGFMGLFIVRETHRGQGHGSKLWFARRDQLLSRLGPKACIGLDGVDAMVPFYAKGGFEPFTRHRRYELSDSSADFQQSSQIVELTTVDFDKITAFDRDCFPAPRDHFLNAWITQPEAIALGFLDHSTLRGFGVMRPCVHGWKIGPLYADSHEIANELFAAFQLHRHGGPIYLDVPENNPIAIDLCGTYDMKEVFGCVRMYYGNPPELDSLKIFGITTLEVG
ncbi:GNAT family N-acetyltransferase [Rubinisphaera margarita]|uniref:GNAT family N-acetyltransferase n=1 Tax=Rubinisphaera margarita TaxID=2909586 RepID=UPI001EE923A8|nr:GNAT family N-acetyltransferase [Rubinisphaera margarita]MCG6154816.1 GNAT family N-acetyltransferase [Rubinisphaera margarita]